MMAYNRFIVYKLFCLELILPFHSLLLFSCVRVDLEYGLIAMSFTHLAFRNHLLIFY